MLNHTGTLWQYLGLFVLYTMFAIGLIYLAYCYLRKNPAVLSGKKQAAPTPKLEIESTLALEPRKNLYVVRAGEERFLIATGLEGTQFLSKLETESKPIPVTQPVPEAMMPAAEPHVELPWFAQPVPLPMERQQGGFGARLLHSIQWLVSSRAKPI